MRILAIMITREDTRPDRMIRAIAVFKFFKSTALVAMGIGAFEFFKPEVSETIRHWVGALAWSAERGVLQELLAKVSGISARHLKEIGVAAFMYAILFLVEGTGLWLGKRWAEYMTLIATGSLFPIEIFELYKKFTVPRLSTLLVNILVFIYLVWVVRRKVA